MKTRVLKNWQTAILGTIVMIGALLALFGIIETPLAKIEHYVILGFGWFLFWGKNKEIGDIFKNVFKAFFGFLSYPKK